MATKTLQLAIQSAVDGVKTVVDAIKTTTDSTKVKVDSTATKVEEIDIKVGTLLEGRVVKSVQRGAVKISTATSFSITLAKINPAKAHVELYGIALTSASNDFPPYVNSLSETQLVIKPSATVDVNFTNNIVLSWEVIEFY